MSEFAIPLATAALLVMIWVPRATRLRAVGIAFLVTSIVAALCATTAVREHMHDASLRAFGAEALRHPHR